MHAFVVEVDDVSGSLFDLLGRHPLLIGCKLLGLPSFLPVETEEDGATAIGLNAQDVEGPLNDQFFYSIVSQPSNGTATVPAAVPNNTCEYRPNKDFYGTDTFTFRASDGTDNGNIATVTVTVTPVDDFPEAQDVSVSIDEDNSITFTLPVVDIDGGPSYSYEINLDQDPSSGSVTISNNEANYTPNLNFYGQDSFRFSSVLENGNSADATATITVNPINDDPTLVIGEVEGQENTVLEITPDATDVDGDPITFSIVENPTNGTASIDGTKIVFTPNTGFERNMTTENDTGGIDNMRNRIFFIFKEDLMFEFSILYEIKLFSVHRWKDEQERFLDSDYSFFRFFQVPPY